MGGVMVGAKPVYLSAAAYRERSEVVPHRDGAVDTARIEAAIADASAECRARLPDDLLDADGAPLALADVADRVADALPGIVVSLAEYRLADGGTGAEEPAKARYESAVKLLEMLRRAPERRSVEAELVEGASQWIPGAGAGAADEDGS